MTTEDSPPSTPVGEDQHAGDAPDLSMSQAGSSPPETASADGSTGVPLSAETTISEGQASNADNQTKSSQKDVEGEDAPQEESKNPAEAEPELDLNQPSDVESVADEEDIDVDQAAKLSSRNLYEAYTQKLSQNDTESDENDSTERASKLVRGFVDYLRTIDKRMGDIEVSLAQRVSALEKITNTEPEAKDKAKNTEEKKKESTEEKPLITDIKFYSAIGEIDADGMWIDNADKEGSYQSKTEDKHMIRVLFNASGTSQAQNTADEGHPNPDTIDIVGFGVQSNPIASFIRDRLELRIGSSDVVRFAKSFRPLIRNIDSFRKQLQRLHERYGSSPASEEKDDQNGAGQVVTMEKNELVADSQPAQISESKGDEDPSYESKEALAHFQVFLEFVEKYFSKQLQLFDRLQKGQETKVAFENLWMLFDAGVTIHCPLLEAKNVQNMYDNDEEVHTRKTRQLPQLFRVVGTRGGVPKDKTVAPSSAAAGKKARNDSLVSDLLLLGEYRTDGQQKQRAAPPVMASSQQSMNLYTPLSVVCFNIDFDGIKYGTVREVFTFKPYDGLADIRTLEAYPTQYLSPVTGQRTEEDDIFLKRGRKFLDATKQAFSYLSYSGWTLGSSREEINGPVVVDFKLSLQEYHSHFVSKQGLVPRFSLISSYWPNIPDDEIFELHYSDCVWEWCHRPGCQWDKYYVSQAAQIKNLEPAINSLFDEYENDKRGNDISFENFRSALEARDLVRLLPGVVPGFVLRNRKWVQLDLNHLQEIQQRDDWENLVLPEGHKDMVQAMVETHTSSPLPNSAQTRPSAKVHMDLVQGKGRGCIILLHGVPGVGKTSTAECVAAYAKKPLYPITCGDIGYSPDDVEGNMQQHFKLADKWGCVLLLDEADVFLAKRNKSDMKRNGLVSVFLRILEYYPGILFLTTNRVGAIDDAFRSRLHLTLYYPQLEGRQALKIWKNLLQRIDTVNTERQKQTFPPISMEKKKIYSWAKLNQPVLQWNGRQIRNAFQTAIALAEFRAKSTEARKSKPSTTSSRASGAKTDVPGPSVTVTDFKTVASASLQFNEYLKETHGMDEEHSAARDQIRRVDKKAAKDQDHTSGRKKAEKKTSKPQTGLRELEDSSTEFSSTQSASGDESDSDGLSDSASAESESEEGPIETSRKSQEVQKATKHSEANRKKHRSPSITSRGKDEEKKEKRKKKKRTPET